MSDRFSELIPYAMKWEGVDFTDDPIDRGGATKWGITQDRLRLYRGWDVSKDEVRNLEKWEAIEIYRAHYWTPIWGDKINHNGVALFLLDCAINHGPGNAARFAQELSGVTVDYAIGPITIAAINDQDGWSLLSRLIERRRRFYEAIMRNDPSQERFRNGWMNRLHDVGRTAQGLDAQPPTPQPRPTVEVSRKPVELPQTFAEKVDEAAKDILPNTRGWRDKIGWGPLGGVGAMWLWFSGEIAEWPWWAVAGVFGSSGLIAGLAIAWIFVFLTTKRGKKTRAERIQKLLPEIINRLEALEK